ncbi:cobalt-precorrin 5A hydrolase / precorrin-3B C17-methyltransferase [Cohaesibacter sp. ES.047]|uniref:precorrin-3B C(17)-methyltransferase n=1 Tax=Cohaesibacter sp. ES.047 TaxID=1798205 RepID=UPI000BB91B00|nr:precorrin-3B C(17)-methyltransferase [Cohaesibacter sp. ES.047]SNY93556.1 cobalt-precorrin 5A hydrolase / precorrin-3B C17-methyltransferase [Cohaesibacter sp. ES.047]
MEEVKRTETGRSLVVLCPSASAEPLATKVRDLLKADGWAAELHGKPDVKTADRSFGDTLTHLRDLFLAGHGIVALCASGIIIRALGPILDSKFSEPPVLSVARNGRSVVPLLGGHHGGNDLALGLAQGLNAHAAITTAGDCQHRISFDKPPEGWRLQNPRSAGPIMARIVDGEPVALDPALTWLSDKGLVLSNEASLAVRSDVHCADDRLDQLVYAPQSLVVGVGCERGLDATHLIAHIEATLDAHNLAPQAIAMLASIDLKMDEAAIHAAARHFKVPARFFSAEELEAEAGRLTTPSDVVFAEVGCHGVAEGAALAGVRSDGTLLVSKEKTNKATCAVGLANAPLGSTLPGQRRGSLSVVGIGPGQRDWRAPEATSRIAAAQELVGYGLYIDLLGSLADGKERKDFPLGGEEDRCRHALEQAGKGVDVALICSGDAGIYAMGTLVMELLDRAEDDGGVSDAAKRAEIVHVPGISALQAASARFGAFLGHDFCTISLSDLLTPWETIEQRLEAAAAGDFVVAFYNPVSRKRRTQLQRAKEILLTKRAGSAPVLLASNLGRPDETLRIRTLETLEVDEVDMLTVVLVGSSQSRTLVLGDRSVGDNGTVAYTPRGYAKRIDADKS